MGVGTDWSILYAGEFNSGGFNGVLRGWGYNQHGELGLQNIINYSQPVAIDGTYSYRELSFGKEHTLGRNSEIGNSYLIGTGSNMYGQLGLPFVFAHRSSPCQIGSNTDWASIATNGDFTMCVKSDGTLWGWGLNTYGELGLNCTSTFYTATQVGNETNWSNVVCFQNFAIARKTDGTLWGCGKNDLGQLGLGDYVNRSTFVQIGSKTDWKNVQFSGNNSNTAGWLKEHGTGQLCWLNSPCSESVIDGYCSFILTEDTSITASFDAGTSPGEDFTLTIIKLGQGDGAIFSNPGGINYGSDSTGSFANGEIVKLYAVSEIGSEFVGWTGGISGYENEISLTMNGSKIVYAIFNKVHSDPINLKTLTINKTGTGSGSVFSSPFGINCGGNCTKNFEYNDYVILHACPSGHDTFSGWSGDITGTNPIRYVLMDSNKTINADFTVGDSPSLDYNLNITMNYQLGNERGFIYSDPAGIATDGSSVGNTATFESGSVVKLYLKTYNGFQFTGWSGSASGFNNPLTVVMNGEKNITANFVSLSNEYSNLSVVKSGNGDGSIVSEPDGINYPSNIDSNFYRNTIVTLAANPNANSKFLGWVGADYSNGNTATVTMNGDKTVYASFETISPSSTRSLTVNVNGAGSGTIVSEPSGINGASGGVFNFPENIWVTLNIKSISNSYISNVNGDGTAVISNFYEQKRAFYMNGNKETNITFNYGKWYDFSTREFWYARGYGSWDSNHNCFTSFGTPECILHTKNNDIILGWDGIYRDWMYSFKPTKVYFNIESKNADMPSQFIIGVIRSDYDSGYRSNILNLSGSPISNGIYDLDPIPDGYIIQDVSFGVDTVYYDLKLRSLMFFA